MSVGCRESKSAQMAIRNVSLPIFAFRVRRIDNPGNIPQLARQKMATQNALGALKIGDVDVLPQEERRLQDISCVVGFAVVRRGFARGLRRPSDFVGNLLQAMLKENLCPLHHP